MEDNDFSKLLDNLEPEPPSWPLPWKDLPRIHRGRGGYRAIHAQALPMFQFASVRRIQLKELSQHLTYGGVLCGLPDEWLNQNHVNQTVRDAAKQFHVEGGRVIVVPPVLRVSTVTSARSGKREEAEIDFLPPVTCIGRFESEPLNPAKDGSTAVIVWFQDHFGLPLKEAFGKVKWEGLATDWDW